MESMFNREGDLASFAPLFLPAATQVYTLVVFKFSDNECTFWSAVEILIKCFDIMDIWTSWTFGHYGHLDIMDIWTSWTFGHHGH